MRNASVLVFLLLPLVLDADAVDDALAEIERKIRAEKERYEKELERLRSEYSTLSKAVVAIQRELAELREKGEELAEEQRKLMERRSMYKRKVGEAKNLLAGIDERVRSISGVLFTVFSAGLPTVKQSEIEEQLKEASSGGSKGLNALLNAYGLFFDSASVVRLIDGDVLCGDGRLHKAELLFFGALGRIYRSKDGGWRGIALASPDAPQGWEYVHNPPRLSDSIEEAFEQAKEKRGYVWLPVDATGRVVAQREREKTTFWEQLQRGGVVMLPIGIVALIAFLLIVVKSVSLKRNLISSPPVKDIVETFKQEGERLVVRLSRSGSASERIFAALLRRHPTRTEVLEEALADAVSVEQARLERFMGAIGVCGTVAPLLGLLGTVTGMIRTFETITAYGAGDVRFLAGGIHEALLTTEAGLIVAIPVLLLHTFLAGRIERMVVHLEHKGSELITALGKAVD